MDDGKTEVLLVIRVGREESAMTLRLSPGDCALLANTRGAITINSRRCQVENARVQLNTMNQTARLVLEARQLT